MSKKRKKYDVKPTARQKAAFIILAENGRNKGKALLRAGYSKGTVVAPTKVTKSRGFQQLIEEYLPDEDLAKKHRELMNKKDIGGGMDVQAVKAALDMGYKIKGHYREDNQQKAPVVLVNIEKAKEIEKALEEI